MPTSVGTTCIELKLCRWRFFNMIQFKHMQQMTSEQFLLLFWLLDSTMQGIFRGFDLTEFTFDLYSCLSFVDFLERSDV